MRWWLCFLAACDPAVNTTPDAPVSDDAPPSPDTPPAVPTCPADASLSICLSFDAQQLGNPLPNEGAIQLSANVTDVARTEGVGDGGAALLSATSQIAFPPNSAIVDIVAIEATVRLDAAIVDGGRVGIIDADKVNPGMSLFIYDGTTTEHRVRCNVGSTDLYADTTIELGTFTRLACTCDGGNVKVWRDGVMLAELAGCAGAIGTTTGLQIGQNGRAGDGLPPNEPLVGAIDRVRLWTSVPPQ